MAHESNWSGWLKRTLRENTTTIQKFQTTALIPEAYVEPLEIRRMLSVGASDTLSWGDTHLPNPSVSQLLAARSIVTSPKLSVFGNNITIAHNDTTPSLEDCTDFGLMSTQTGALVRKYTLKNNGDQTLNLIGSKPITISGAGTDFTVVTQPPEASPRANPKPLKSVLIPP